MMAAFTDEARLWEYIGTWYTVDDSWNNNDIYLFSYLSQSSHPFDKGD
jgi:hypothetical protein